MILVLTDDIEINHLCSDSIEYNDINIISVKHFFEEILNETVLVPLNKVYSSFK